MKFKIINTENEDFFIISGDTVEEIQQKVKIELT